jgi:hypothetical protein
MERRRYPRLEIKATCRIRRASKAAAVRAVTQNISRNGLLISLTGTEKVTAVSGDFWTIEVDLPPSGAFARRCLRCAGKVTRVTAQAGGGQLVAVDIWKMAFRDLRKGAVPEVGEVAGGPQILWPRM